MRELARDLSIKGMFNPSVPPLDRGELNFPLRYILPQPSCPCDIFLKLLSFQGMKVNEEISHVPRRGRRGNKGDVIVFPSFRVPEGYVIFNLCIHALKGY